MNNHFGFGIVDKNNQPYGVTSPDREALDREVELMNISPNLFDVVDRVPLKVVPLFWTDEGKK